MKTLSTHSMDMSFRFCLNVKKSFLALFVISGASLLGTVSAAPATSDTWTGTTSSNFELLTNWTGGTPANDTLTNYALFDATVTNQPTLSKSRSIGGLQFTDPIGNVTLGDGGKGFTLTLGAVVPTGPGVGIDAGAVTSGSDTISVTNVALNSSQSWLVGTGGTLVVSSVITDGATPGSALTINNGTLAGTVELTGLSTYTGGTTVKSGTLVLNGSGAGNTGTIQGTLTINLGATVVAGVANALGFATTGQVSQVNINGGTLTEGGANMGLETDFTLTGGTININAAGTSAGGNLFFGGSANPTLTTDASSTTSTIIVPLQLRGPLTITTASGTTSSGIDLLISGGIVDGFGVNDSIIKAGTGTLELTGPANYTGTTTISAGTLKFGTEVSLYNNTTTSWTAANILVASGATVAFGVGGAGQFTTGDVTTLLTNLDGAVSNDGLGAHSTIGFDTTSAGGGTFTISNNIADTTGTGGGSVGLAKLGTGALVLTGKNTYTGGTTISAGTLTISGAGDLGSGSYAGNIANSGTFNYNSSAAQTLSGVISGSGALTQSGSGTLTITGKNTYTGPTTISAGTLTISGAGDLGSGTYAGAIANNGTFNYNSSAAQTLSGVISGSGVLTKSGAGTLTLTGVDTYTGGTTISAGTLAIGSGGSIAKTSGVNLAAGGVTFDISGGGNQSVNNLSGVNGSFVSLGAKKLTVTNSGTNSFGGVIKDGGLSGGTGGSLTVAGSGELILTGANTYTGLTTIDSGATLNALDLKGSVTNSGTLGVAGPIGTTLTIGAASSPTAFTSDGTLIFRINDSSSDVYNIMGTGATDLLGTTPVLDGFGTTPLGGRVVLTSAGPLTFFTNSSTYKIVTSLDTAIFTLVGNEIVLNTTQNRQGIGSLAQTPNQAAVANAIDSALTAGTLSANIGNTLNNLTAAQIPGFLDELSPESLQYARNIAFENSTFLAERMNGVDADLRNGYGGLDTNAISVVTPGFESGLGRSLGSLLAYDDPVFHQAAPNGVNYYPGGESTSSPSSPSSAAPSTPTWDSSTQVISDSPNPYLANQNSSGRDTPRFSEFIGGDVILADLNQNQSAPNAPSSKASYTAADATAGVSFRMTSHLAAGVLFDYNHTDAKTDSNGGKTDVDSYSPGVFATYFDKGFYVNGLFSFGYNNYSNSRDISFLGETASSHPSGRQYVSDLDFGYDFHPAKNWVVGPTLGLTYTHLDIDSFTETGAPGADLAVQDQSVDSLRSRLGGHVVFQTNTGDVLLQPNLTAMWQHEYLDGGSGITSSFNDFSSTPFTIQAAAPSRNSALIGCGLTATLSNSMTLYLNYLADVGAGDYWAQSVVGGFKARF